MPLVNKEERNAYIKEWKRKQREELGLPKRGKHIRKPRTEEELLLSKEKKKEYSRLYQRNFYKNNPATRMYYSAKARAKRNNIPFDIELSDITLPLECPYLGIPLVSSRSRGDARRDIYSLDRIDNSKGYTKGNVEVISWLANTMKGDAPPELLLNFAKTIIHRYETLSCLRHRNKHIPKGEPF